MADKTCTICGSTWAATYRKDKETKETICGSCYNRRAKELLAQGYDKAALKALAPAKEPASTTPTEASKAAPKVLNDAAAPSSASNSTPKESKDSVPFPKANSQENADSDKVFDRFRMWMIVKQAKPEGTAKDYVRAVTQNFRRFNRSWEAMATEEFRIWVKVDPDTGKKSHANLTTGLKWWQSYYLTEVKTSASNGSAAARKENASKPAAAATASSTKPDAKAEAKADTKAGTVEDTKVNAKADVKVEVKPEVGAETKADVKADVKSDVKEDAKAEVKPDGKPENRSKNDLKEEPGEEKSEEDQKISDEIERMLSGMDTNVELKEKKHKKHHSDAPSADPELTSEQIAEMSTLEIDSETEYPDLDISDAPEKVRVEGSGRKAIDGLYHLIPKSARGRPSYIAFLDKKAMYLFWNKKKWMIGSDYGSSRNVASVKDEELTTPCEPYPSAWKVFSKETHEYLKMMSLRVIDVALSPLPDGREKLPSQLDEPRLLGGLGTGERKRRAEDAPKLSGEDGGELPIKAKKQKVAKTPESKKSDGADKVASGKGDSAPAKLGAKKDAPPKGATGTAKPDGAGKADTTAKSDEEEAPESEISSSSEESETEESSESSSSESGSEEASPKPAAQENRKAATPATPPTPPPKPLTEEEKRKAAAEKAEAFESRLRAQVARLAPEAVPKYLLRLKESMHKKGTKLEDIAGGEDKVKEIFERLLKTCGPKEDSKPKTATNNPVAPKKDGLAQPVTPPEVHSRQDNEPHHRQFPQKRSALKKPYAPRTKQARHISYTDIVRRESLTMEVAITCYRGEPLWVSMPGAVVVCDSCDRGVPQTMGSLQGAPGHSQFAQDRFICNPCLGISY